MTRGSQRKPPLFPQHLLEVPAAVRSFTPSSAAASFATTRRPAQPAVEGKDPLQPVFHRYLNSYSTRWTKVVRWSRDSRPVPHRLGEFW